MRNQQQHMNCRPIVHGTAGTSITEPTVLVCASMLDLAWRSFVPCACCTIRPVYKKVTWTKKHVKEVWQAITLSVGREKSTIYRSLRWVSPHVAIAGMSLVTKKKLAIIYLGICFYEWLWERGSYKRVPAGNHHVDAIAMGVPVRSGPAVGISILTKRTLVEWRDITLVFLRWKWWDAVRP